MRVAPATRGAKRRLRDDDASRRFAVAAARAAREIDGKRASAADITRAARALFRALELSISQNARVYAEFIALCISYGGVRGRSTRAFALASATLLAAYRRASSARRRETSTAREGRSMGTEYALKLCERGSALAGAVLERVATAGTMPVQLRPRGWRVRVEDVESETTTRRTSISSSSASSSASTSASDVIFVGEARAMGKARKENGHWSSQTRALGLRVQGVVEDGNCCFRSIAHGVKALARHKVWDIKRVGSDWRDIRARMCDELEKRRKAMRRKTEIRALYNLLMNGDEGRRYLRVGKFKRASDDERFKEYIRTMRKDAAPYTATKIWTRFWGTDAELCAIASLNDVAIVCVETTDERVPATAKSPFFLAAPRRDERNGVFAPARYLSDGRFRRAGKTVEWRCRRARETFTLSLVTAAIARRRCRHGGDTIPALCVKHFPGHFEALVPDDSSLALVLDRSTSRRWNSNRH